MQEKKWSGDESRVPGETIPVQGIRPSAGNTDWSPGTVLLEEYEIELLLGRGGMGTVFLVRRIFDDALFAVKTLHDRDVEDTRTKRTFIGEIRTWLELPEHPNLTACRFFRTIQDRLAIFSEYVDGHSLAEWISGGRLSTLPGILDIAIQFAWGLHITHSCGIIHQDVKPGNVLMSRNGTPKITDFGLARALVGRRSAARAELDSGVSAGGMTVAYCSPEQAEGWNLTAKTDMWSWAVSVFEMFVRKRSWQVGFMMPAVLDAYAAHPDRYQGVPIPGAVMAVLRRCVDMDPEARWPEMRDIVEELIRIRADLPGEPFRGELRELARGPSTIATEYQRETHTGGWFDDPREWQKKAYRFLGAPLPPRPSSGDSRQSRLLADLEMFEDALSIYRSRMDAGSPVEMIRDLAHLYRNIGTLNNEIGDISGAKAAYLESASAWQRVYRCTGDVNAESAAAQSLTNICLVLTRLGQLKEALEHGESAIARLEALLGRGEEEQIKKALATAYLNTGNIQLGMGQPVAAQRLYEQAALYYREILSISPEIRFEAALGIIDMNLTVIFCNSGDNLRGEYHADRAISVFERLVSQEDLALYKVRLTTAYTNKSMALGNMKQYREAIEYTDKAIALLNDLVLRDGRERSVSTLMYCYSNKINALRSLKEYSSAFEILDKAFAFIHHRIDNQGRNDLLPMLLALQITAFELMLASGRHEGELAMIDAARKVIQRMKDLEVSGEYRSEELSLRMYEVFARHFAGELDTARTLAISVIRDMEAANERSGIGDHEVSIQRVREYLADMDSRRSKGNLA